jgi:hypothetical protein
VQLSHALIDAVKAYAAAEVKELSPVVDALLGQALTDQWASTDA